MSHSSLHTNRYRVIGIRARTVVVSGYSPSVSTLPDGNTVTIGGAYPWSDSATVTLTKTAVGPLPPAPSLSLLLSLCVSLSLLLSLSLSLFLCRSL